MDEMKPIAQATPSGSTVRVTEEDVSIRQLKAVMRTRQLSQEIDAMPINRV